MNLHPMSTDVRRLSITKIQQELEEQFSTNKKTKMAASMDTKSKDRISMTPLEDSLVLESGSTQQTEHDGPVNPITGIVTVEKAVSTSQQVMPGGDSSAQHVEGKDDEHDPPSPTSPSPPEQEPRYYASATEGAVFSFSALSQLSIGATLALPHFLHPQLDRNTHTFLNTELHLTSSLISIGDYLFLAGLVIILVPAGWLVTSLGRRTSLFAATAITATSWALHAIAINALLFLIGRFFAGVSVALLKVSVTTYLTEVTVVQRRGRTLVCLEMMNITGAIACFGLNVFLRWYEIAFLNLALMLICLGAVFFFPESPSYLLLEDREEEARKALQRLRASNSNVEEELLIIKSYNPPEKAKTAFSSLLRKPIISHTVTLVGLSVMSVFSGSIVIMRGGADMLLQAGLTWRREEVIVIVLICLIAGCFLLYGLVDRTGRRLCLIMSLMILVVVYMALGGVNYTHYLSIDSPTLPKTWLTVHICLIFLAALSLTFGSYTVPIILAAEYFPSYCRPQGFAVFLTITVLLQTLILHLQPLIEATLGLAGLYWVFGAVSLLGIVYTNYGVHEVKYRTHNLYNVCQWLYKENLYEPRPII